ncbi:TnsA-like heteromeric transposase endonuclease subunit [Microbacterium sp. NPDC089696]|uniref:TnsA-like heteromeric transposase endonuclease subunit n=1 Tax=Microbacterium sp. NPDC089696 TaxID=3364199 RepID=UPI00382261E0
MTENTKPAPGTATWVRDGINQSAPLDSGLITHELYNADPIRVGNAYPHQRNYHGYYWMSAVAKHVWHESLLERSSLMWLDHTSDIVAIASQPMLLVNGNDVWHYPDFIALDAHGIQTVYDVKPYGRLTAKALAQFEWTREVCKTVGWNYRILTELPHQHHVNLTWLAQFRRPGHHPGADAEESLLADLQPDSTVGDAITLITAKSTPLARSHVFHLIWTGALSIDMNALLSNSTPLITPASHRQEFPHAHA